MYTINTLGDVPSWIDLLPPIKDAGCAVTEPRVGAAVVQECLHRNQRRNQSATAVMESGQENGEGNKVNWSSLLGR